ncbi:MAG: hypothetical protein A3C93_02250 [Candidatus Lloydbacteria bacterium RIFCSPHIGHO2_02_FULL_54_17]|uniref:Uncharacterized protein n=1 Tax=Candidatus Lloydbacteria bacterium RIFCSPHIGHO2_02_FULL_54_17 TaxID=1798664 RepID=A0A1G2DDM1_9BACT|nr:MAG: hypothetical protein A2762_02160 [Candidatus Lloydbacteria bacterium RIFCSPHIGHO2_01_FULL_54_11]OGZ11734.1 MAG: hypothetical protein A3C93_02250 [Candidatus Lloydbacteria bacterium RIFCSPHIGHO2_02_FULL_54_17]OGZ14263.1 MAG: hypothetical protein A2948_01585 [Candidatus Lloydbacteria bacterium RIFCSPLOWO2_01_FULL_54_18]
MVKHSVTYGRLMNMAYFRVGNKETQIWSVAIFPIAKLAIKYKDVFFKLKFKLLYIFFPLLIFSEFIPRRKEVIERCNFFKYFYVPFHISKNL